MLDCYPFAWPPQLLSRLCRSQEAIAAGLLNTESSLVRVEVFPGAEEGEFAVVGVTATGEALLWDCQATGPTKAVAMGAQGSLVARVLVQGATPAEAIHAARVDGLGAGRLLMLARGSIAKPTFERVAVATAAVAPNRTLELELSDRGLLLPTAKSSSKDSRPPLPRALNVVESAPRVDDDLDMAVAVASVADPHAPKRKRKHKQRSEDGDGEVDAEADGMTLGERVAALNLDNKGAGQVEGPEEEEQGGASTSGPIKADSLGVLLIQVSAPPPAPQPFPPWTYLEHDCDARCLRKSHGVLCKNAGFSRR